MKNASLLKINPLIHCLENEMNTAYQNIGKITVNELLAYSGRAGVSAKFKEQADYTSFLCLSFRFS